jgi:ADP-ribose pyrophosphatase
MTNRKIGDWTQLDTKKIFENDFFTVREDDVIEPDGKNGKYATIDVKSGVAVLPLDDEDNVYLTRQFRYAIERPSVEAIAGSLDDEEPLDGAKREAKEELGIEAREWTPLGKIEVLTSICRSTTYLFLAGGLTFTKPERESTEDIKQLRTTLDEAFEKVISGEIVHADTCVLVVRAWKHKKRQRPNEAAAQSAEEEAEEIQEGTKTKNSS